MFYTSFEIFFMLCSTRNAYYSGILMTKEITITATTIIRKSCTYPLHESTANTIGKHIVHYAFENFHRQRVENNDLPDIFL